MQEISLIPEINKFAVRQLGEIKIIITPRLSNIDTTSILIAVIRALTLST